MMPIRTFIELIQNLLFAIDLNFECLEYEEIDGDYMRNLNQTVMSKLA